MLAYSPLAAMVKVIPVDPVLKRVRVKPFADAIVGSLRVTDHAPGELVVGGVKTTVRASNSTVIEESTPTVVVAAWRCCDGRTKASAIEAMINFLFIFSLCLIHLL